MRKHILIHILFISFVLVYKPVIHAEGENPPTITDPVTGMVFVLVNGGCFDMGDLSNIGDDDEKPVHEVCIDDYYIGKYEVTLGQWEVVMGENPSDFNNGSNYPVETVSWNAVQKFIRKLNRKTGQDYRLPTEAEWEYAARSGGKREESAGFSDENDTYSYANFCDVNCKFKWKTEDQDDGYENTSPVGNYKPNGLGLYDMAGNVWEWCSDWYGLAYYRNSPNYNPGGPLYGFLHVIRGGSWYNFPDNLRVSKRNYNIPDYSSNRVGFRLVSTP